MRVRLGQDGSEILVEGDLYFDVLRRAHEALQPRSYFEIGTLFGDTLRLAHCRSVAVDPKFQLRQEAPPLHDGVKLFEETSDSFFATQDPARLLGRPIDLAFLDGMHEFDFLLRDFIATERFCRSGSIILLHDCLPGDDFMTRPYARMMEKGSTNFPDWWTGDVWKMVPVLRAHRPDLQVTCLDAMPTGLVAVTNLDPDNRVLQDRYDALVAQWRPVRFAEFGAERLLETAAVQACEDWSARLRPFGFVNQVRRALGEVRGRVRRLSHA